MGEKRTTMEKCLCGFVIFLILVAAALATLFVIYYKKAENDDNNNVCSSRNCVITASKLAHKMDTTSDPCQDFAQYACGGFYKDTIIPDDKTKVTSFSLVTDKNEQLLRTIMEDPVMDDDIGYIKKMKTYYQNCMDIDTIENIGLRPYITSQFAREWPTLNPRRTFTRFNLNNIIERYMREFRMPLFDISVSTDLMDSNKHQLAVSQPSLLLPLKYMKRPRNDSVLMAYQKYVEDYAIALGANPVIAKQDAKNFVDFEIKLAKIMVTPEESIDLKSLNNPTTLNQMSLDYPFIDFHRAVQAGFDSISKTIPRDLIINNWHPKYFANLQAVLDATDQRTLRNYFGFKYATGTLGTLTKRLGQVRHDFMKVYAGTQKEDPRWRTCLGSTTDFIGDAVSKAFIKAAFSEDSKKYMDTMIANLKEAFVGILNETAWMGPTTREAALLKLNEMRREIGYPDEDYLDEFIEKKNENRTVIPGEFYKTNMEVSKQKIMEKLRMLDKDVSNNTDELPVTVNAFNAGTLNLIVFPAGILQPPFYSDQAPSSINYGAIGSIIGHEITHGFDQRGSQFDHRGDLKNWWHPEDLKEFHERSQCVIDYYSNFEMKEIGLKVNGNLTAAENTADIGGLKEAYRAYKTYSAKQPKELPLPGLDLTLEQQFFLAYAQVDCAKETDASKRISMLSGVHAPGIFRIRGTLQNLDIFSQAFNCPVGSPMNPAKKCVVW